MRDGAVIFLSVIVVTVCVAWVLLHQKRSYPFSPETMAVEAKDQPSRVEPSTRLMPKTRDVKRVRRIVRATGMVIPPVEIPSTEIMPHVVPDLPKFELPAP